MTKNVFPACTTGLSGLDDILHGIRPGDNLVWDMKEIGEYAEFVLPFTRAAFERGRKITYFRFADHEPLLSRDERIRVLKLNPDRGFEPFVSAVVDTVETDSADAWFVFDCLSGLAESWYSDRMMANFFLVVCPFVLSLGSLAYFSLYKHRHSSHATDTIRETAQIIIETFRYGNRMYVQPQRVDGRHSSTMYMLHEQDGNTFRPVMNSALITDAVGSLLRPVLAASFRSADIWSSLCRETTSLIRTYEHLPEQEKSLLRDRLIRMIITRQSSFMPLAKKYFDLPFIMDILKRYIGSGLIGGKARGILLARRILEAADPSLKSIFENHDSFFIGSDVFFTYVVQNDCWWLRRKQGKIEDIIRRAAVARDRILTGKFQDYIIDQFIEMLEYFGQAPVIVRSSSLQEDSYGIAFSGKYESVFCANQGTPEQRLEEFLAAVRTVYASSMSEEALYYRLHHGLLYEDEQMALLVQRVSGDVYGTGFFPPCAGVGFSYNPFVWDPDIDPDAGMLRLAFGLGTRAVDRVDNDYTRIVALNVPLRRTEKDAEDPVRYSQHFVDVIDLEKNRFTTIPLETAFDRIPEPILNLLSDPDPEATELKRSFIPDSPPVRRLTFNGIFSDTDFCGSMRKILRLLAKAYGCPVDIEYTVNFIAGNSYRINLVQCRPFGVKIVGTSDVGIFPESTPEKNIFLRSEGPIVGRSMAAPIDRIVYVSPSAYTRLSEQERYAAARLIGRLIRLPYGKRKPIVLLVGPGRWGTSTPAMGVPVTFREIKDVNVIVELAIMHEGLVPDVSLGTHFFNDLVEMDMLYFAVFPNRGNGRFSEEFFDEAKKYLSIVEPDDPLWEKTVTVLDDRRTGSGPGIRLFADASAQKAVCYLVEK